MGMNEIAISASYPASSVNTLFAIAFTAANLQSLALVASSNMTIKTNSSSSPDNTINLVAGDPFVWSKSLGYEANPFSVDVTSFYISCTQSANLTGKILLSS